MGLSDFALSYGLSSFTKWRTTYKTYTWTIYNIYVFSFLFQSDSKITNNGYKDMLSGVYRVFNEFKSTTIKKGRSSKKLSKSIINLSNGEMRNFLAYYRGIEVEHSTSENDFNNYIENNKKNVFMNSFNLLSLAIFKELMIKSNIMIKYYKVNRNLINEYTKKLTMTDREVRNKKDVKSEIKSFIKKEKELNK